MARGLFAVLFCGLLAACGGGPATRPPTVPPPLPVEDPAHVTWEAKPGGLTLHLVSRSDLNEMDGTPLGLSLCVYQVADTKRFKALAATSGGLDALQECTVEAADAVAAKRFWMQPGEYREVVMDRAEGAKNLAVVAGYAHLKPELSAAVVPFLLHSEKQGYIPFFRTTVHSAALMEIIINLTASAVDAKGVERDK
ncbi:MAG: type VI secretion system lipoprotein TssJ [Candidatus Accumulibacter sp.]|jgi:type VI secretion system VasD/TssJ family lipoprotein|nr:type VI secretion system lipoprotein TssJ [Accumulibacter sp.]